MPALANFWTETLEKSGATILVAVLTTVLSFTLGRWWGRWRARRQWQAKEFLGRIIVSLNSFQNDTLKIRTGQIHTVGTKPEATPAPVAAESAAKAPVTDEVAVTDAGSDEEE